MQASSHASGEQRCERMLRTSSSRVCTTFAPTEGVLAQKLIAHRIARAIEDLGLHVPLAASFEAEPAPDEVVDLATIHTLWETAIHSGAPRSFPVTTALVPLAEMRSALTFLCTSSGTLGEAVMHLVENWRSVVSQASTWRFESRGDVVRLVLDARAPTTLGEKCHLEYLVADLVHTARLALGFDVTPTKMAFRHEAPSDDARHRQLFGEGLSWNGGELFIEVSQELLARRMTTSAPGLAAVVSLQVEAMKRRSEPTSDRARVREVLTALFAERACDVRLAVVARRLGTSGRTLLRRLRGEGTTYQALLDEVRRESARELIATHRLSSKEVAAALAFSDARAFARAFRRWTGRAPGSLRVAWTVPTLSSLDG